MECSVEREKIKKKELPGVVRVKRAIDWDSILKAERDKQAQKKRKLRARKRRKAYRDFVKSEFEGTSILLVQS